MYSGHSNQPFSKYYVDQLGAERIVLVYDCCHAGAIGETMREEGREILCSSRGDEESTEGNFSGTSYSAFIYYLIQGFTNPMVDKNRDGWISAQEAFEYAKPLKQNTGINSILLYMMIILVRYQ